MHARARILGHPIHQIMIVFPLGLLSTSFIFDLVYLWSGNARWAEIAFWMVISGIVGGLVSAPFGLIDWLAIPKATRARYIGALHGWGNVLVLLLFSISAYIRMHETNSLAIALSGAGIFLAMGTGWLGGELVDRLGIGVDEGANVNAPNSLSGRPASASGRMTGS